MNAVGPHFYDPPSLRGMHIRPYGVPPLPSPNLIRGYPTRSEANDDVNSEPPSDSVRSMPSAGDDLYDLHSNVSVEFRPGEFRARSYSQEDYQNYLSNDAFLRQVTGSSGSSVGSRSVTAWLRDLPRDQGEWIRGDSELSDPRDFLGVETEESRDSDDELFNMDSGEDDYDHRADEVPLPPQLPE
eukprot:CAMPEP_0172664810 /NCGR_PEP_ID=MMETSP1074-20121228/6847_1 /TAXON_ID=2916 /ORGANISM="Ceratium fusus, Strain PA161109" /LENGTH=184 /DNA_ID=CAMNT_0013481031 /DNA_START=53 /DNA_END=604 /DNA_ORIENTATION=+